MKRMLTLILVAFAIVGTEHVSNAALYTIGTANYGGNDYKLIYEGNLGGFGLVWLDYTSARATWQDQTNWAAGLSFMPTQVTLDTARYRTTIDWSTGWRLPGTDESKADLFAPWSTDVGDGMGSGWGGPDEGGYHGYWRGYNMVNSEMGHLFYESLGNKGYYAKDGTFPQSGFGLNSQGDFEHLSNEDYWSGSQYSPAPSCAWYFLFSEGYQNRGDKAGGDSHALAVHPGVVSLAAVPIPSAMWLLGTGLIGFIGVRRRFFKKN